MREEPTAPLCAFEGALHPADAGEPVEVVYAIRHLFRPEALVRLRPSLDGMDAVDRVRVCAEHAALLRGEPLEP